MRSGDESVLALDVGTSLSKLQCFGVDGGTIGPMMATSTPVRPDGRADAATFLGVVETLLDRFCADPPLDGDGRRPAIRGCVLTCLWHGLVGVDGSQEPCTQVSTWMDGAASAEAEELRLAVDETAVQERTGCRLHPSYAPARLLRLRRKEPEAWSRVASWVSIGELLLGRWCTPAHASFSMASGSGLFDSRLHRWDPELAALVGVSEAVLPRVSDEWRRLRPRNAERWPLLADAMWMPALGDGGCSVVGSGAATCRVAGKHAGDGEGGGGCDAIALSLGTSASARLVTDWTLRFARPLRPALFAYALDDTRAVVGVARSNMLNLVRWAERALNFPSAVPSEDLVEQIVRERRPGSSGLVASSAFAGERSPQWPVAAEGLVAGLSLTTSSLDILQSLVETAVVGLVKSIGELERWAGAMPIILSGGGARSEGWQRMITDGLGRPVFLSEVADTSLRGAALLCLERLDLLRQEEEAVPVLHVIEPDPARAEAFAELLIESR